MTNNNTIEAGIKLDGEKEFKSAVSSCGKEISKLGSESDVIKEKFAGQANSLEALRAKHDVLSKTLDAQKRKYDETQKGLDHAKESYANVGKGLDNLYARMEKQQDKLKDLTNIYGESSEEVKKQKEEITKLSNVIREGEGNYEKAGARIGKWEVDLNKAEAQVIRSNRSLEQNATYMKEAEGATDKCATSIDGYGKATKKAAEQADDFGKTAKAGIEELAGILAEAGVAAKVTDIARALKECVDAANQFETGMAKAYTIADSGIVSVDNMKKSIIDLSNATGTASKAVAEDVYSAISAGQDTADAVNFTSNATKLSIAGFAETAQTLDVLTTILNAYGMESKDVTKVSDMLVQTQNKGKVTVAQLSSVMGKIIPTAKDSKVSLEQLTAGYAIMTSKGIAAAETTTYMNSMLDELSKSGTVASTALKEATGSSLQELMDSGRSLGEVLDILQQQAVNSGKSLRDMFGSGEAGKAAASLLSGGVKAFNDQVEGMRNSAGATDIAFNKMSRTAEFAEKKFKTSADNLKIAIGEQLSPALKKLHETGVDAFEWAAEFVKKNPSIVSAFTGLIAAAGVLVTGLVGLLVAKKVIAVMKVLNATLAANPAVLVASAIAGLVVAVGAFALSAEDATDQTRELIKSSDELIESTQKNRDERAQSKIDLESEYGAAQKLSEELYNLADKENKSAGEKARMSEIVGLLNQQMPELNATYDEQTDKLNLNRDAMDKNIESMKKQGIAAAAQEDINRIQGDILEIEKEKYKLGKEREALDGQLTAAQERLTAAQAKSNEELKETGSISGTTLKEIQESLKGQDEIQAKIDDVTGALGRQNDAGKELSDELDVAGNIYEKNADKTKKLADETDELTEATKQAAESAFANAEIQAQALEAVQSKFEETKSSIQQSLEQKINMFDVFSGGEDMSVEKMLENLDSQLEGIENYKVNLETIKDQVGKTIAPEFLQYIEDMGMDGANTLEHMVATLNQDNGAELLKEMSDKYVKALDVTEEIAEKGAANKTAMEIANGKLGSTKADFSGLRNSIDTAVSDATSSWSKLPDNTRAELDRVIQVAQETGVKIPDGLAESIKSGETSPTEAINQMNSAISGTFEGLVSIAQEAGITIPDGIKDGIASGGDAAVKAYQELIQLLQQTGVESETNAQQSGKTSADKYAESMQAQSGTVKNAGSNVAKSGIDGINSHQMEFQNTGTAAMQSMANGVSGGIYLVQAKAGQAASDANNSAALYHNAFSSTGGNLALGLANGFIAKAPAVAAAARAAVANAVKAANDEGQVKSPSRVFRNKVGIFLSKGLELGILDGKAGVARSAREIAWEAINASKSEFDVNSPSRVFIKMGKNLGEGLEIGIKGKTKAAVKASSKMAKEVYKEASSWLTTYKKTHDVTLAQEESFWRKVARTVKKGTDEYKAAVKNANSIKSFKNQVNSNVEDAFGVSRTEVKNKKTVDKDAKKYYSELTKAATTYIENKKKTNKISLQQEKYFWEQVKKGAGETTQTYADASGKVKAINKKIKDGIDAENKKIEEKEKAAAEKAVSRLENSIASKKKYSSLTAAEETAMWDKLIKEAEKKGGKYLKVVQKQANAAKKEIEQANKEYGLSGSGLDSYKTYYNVSAKAEMEYWDIVRKNRKLTNAQRIEADQKYLESKKSYNEQMKDLEDDYYDKCKDVSEKLADDIKEATEKYNEAVADRKDSIKSAFGTFDEFKSESEGPKKLLANMESQVAGYALWEQQLEELSSKGVINPKFMDELRNMGPEATATILSLNMMSEEELNRANEAWNEKDRLAEAQAVKENEALRKQTEENIKTMKTEAQKKLDAYKVEYDNASKVLSEAMEAPLRELANKALTLGSDATAKFIMGVGNAAKSSDATKALKGATRQLAQGLESLPKAGKEIGKDTLAGILSGMSNKLEIKKGAKSIVAELEKAIKKEAGINSPSRRFKESIGLQIPAGVAQGVEEGAEKASRSGAQMIRTMLDKSKAQLKNQQSALADYNSKLNWSGGIEALNRIISVSPTQVQNIKVDNSGLTNTLEGMVKRIEEMGESIKNIKLVLDNGTLVGEIAPDMGGELAVNARRWAY